MTETLQPAGVVKIVHQRARDVKDPEYTNVILVLGGKITENLLFNDAADARKRFYNFVFEYSVGPLTKEESATIVSIGQYKFDGGTVYINEPKLDFKNN